MRYTEVMATPKKTGRRQRYTKAEKIVAVQAMKADAKSRPDGRPNLLDVSRATGVSRGSLRTWWSQHRTGRFDEAADSQEDGRPELHMPPLPCPLAEMSQAQYAQWRLESLQAVSKYAAEVGNVTAVPTIDKRMSEHQAVVLAEREKAAPASTRLERLRAAATRAGLLG